MLFIIIYIPYSGVYLQFFTCFVFTVSGVSMALCFKSECIPQGPSHYHCICGKMITTKASLVAHLRTHIRHTSYNTVDSAQNRRTCPIKIKKERRRWVTSNICHKILHLSSRRRHMVTKHKGSSNVSGEVQKIKTRKGSLAEHLSNINGEVQKVGTRKGSSAEHLSNVNGEVQKVGTRKGSSAEHLSTRIHPSKALYKTVESAQKGKIPPPPKAAPLVKWGQKLVTCDICDQVINSKSLKRHIFRKHSSEKAEKDVQTQNKSMQQNVSNDISDETLKVKDIQKRKSRKDETSDVSVEAKNVVSSEGQNDDASEAPNVADYEEKNCVGSKASGDDDEDDDSYVGSEASDKDDDEDDDTEHLR